jgi:hypothetical protein
MMRTGISMIFAAVAIRTSTPLDGKRHVLENTNLVIEGRPAPTLIDGVEAAPRPELRPQSTARYRAPEQFL